MKRVVLPAESVRVVRLGHGANCSSIGSVLDLLFATATIGSAVFAAAAAAVNERERDPEDDAETGGEPDPAHAHDVEPSRDAP